MKRNNFSKNLPVFVCALVFLIFPAGFAGASCSDPTNPVSPTGECKGACDSATEEELSGAAGCMGGVCCVAKESNNFPAVPENTGGGGGLGTLPDGAICTGSSVCQSGNCAGNDLGQFVCTSGSFPVDLGNTGNPSAGAGAGAAGGWSLNSISGFGLPQGTIWGIASGIMFWLLAVLGLVGIIGFIISGILYLISTGDEDMITRAKKAMQWSIVGVVVGLIGVVIIQAIDLMLRGSGWF